MKRGAPLLPGEEGMLRAYEADEAAALSLVQNHMQGDAA